MSPTIALLRVAVGCVSSKRRAGGKARQFFAMFRACHNDKKGAEPYGTWLVACFRARHYDNQVVRSDVPQPQPSRELHPLQMHASVVHAVALCFLQSTNASRREARTSRERYRRTKGRGDDLTEVKP